MKRIVISIQKMLVVAFCSLFVSMPTYAASGVDYSSNDASLGTSPDNHTGGIDSCYASSGSNQTKFIDSIGTFYWKSQTCNYGPQ